MSEEKFSIKEFDVAHVFGTAHGAYLVVLVRKNILNATTRDDVWKLFHVHGEDTQELHPTIHVLRPDWIALTTERSDELLIESNGSATVAHLNGRALTSVNLEQYRIRQVAGNKLRIRITPRSLANSRA